MNMTVKTAFDKVSSVTGLLVASPIIALVSLVNAFHFNNKNPFYPVERVGKDGIPFNMLKFRSMHDTDGLSDEQRSTNWGKFLRATAIDELPQLINVAKGDMSLVGPRPRSVVECRHLKEHEKCLLSVKPGLTGLWQVSVIGKKYGQPREERNALAAQYVKERGGMMRDLAILAKTVPAFFKGHDGEYLSYNFKNHAVERQKNHQKETGNSPD